MLDLIDASSLGQSALEAKTLGADALLVHIPTEDVSQLTFMEMWDMVKGNTPLPIYLSGNFNTDTLATTLTLNPAAIVIGKEITMAQNPEAEAQKFSNLIRQK